MKILFITNVLTPYRIYFFDSLNKLIKKQNGKIKVLVMLSAEHNPYWHYDDYKRDYTELLSCYYIGKSKGEFFINRGVSKKINEFNPNILVACSSYWYPTILKIVSNSNRNYKLLYWSESNKIKVDTTMKLKRFIREKLRKYTYSKFDGFLYPGELAKELICEYNSKSRFLYCLPNLIDEKKYYNSNEEYIKKDYYKNKLKLPLDKIILFCPARLSNEKGILEFLDEYIKSSLSVKSTVLIAGTGELKDIIEKKIKLNNIDVKLLGYITQDKMIEYYKASDMFLLPSLSDPSPLSAIEALWSGLPLLLSDKVGNLPEVLIENMNGFSFNYNDNPHKVFDKISALNNKWFIDARKTSLKIAKERFSSYEVIKDMLNKLEEFVY